MLSTNPIDEKLFRKARGKSLRLPGVKPNNTHIRQEENGDMVVRLYSTDVARFNPATGIATLHSGGWRTETTKERINAALRAWGLRNRVYQERGIWLLGPRFEFYDGVTVTKECNP